MSSSKPQAECAILLVTYNNESEISACLCSIARAGNSCRLQLVIVDNASRDQTLQHIREFLAASPALEVQLIENAHNMFFTAAINQALQQVSAPFILFLNPDTVLPEAALPALIARLRSAPEIGAIAPQLCEQDGHVQPSCRRFPTHWNILAHLLGLSILWPASRRFNGWKMGDFDHRHEAWVEQPQGACLLTKREVIEKVGGWDEAYPMFFSDVDWCRRVVAAGYKILFTPAVRVIHHRGRSVRQLRPRMIGSSHRSFIRYFWTQYRGGRWLFPNLFMSFLLALTGLVRMLAALFSTFRHSR